MEKSISYLKNKEKKSSQPNSSQITVASLLLSSDESVVGSTRHRRESTPSDSSSSDTSSSNDNKTSSHCSSSASRDDQQTSKTDTSSSGQSSGSNSTSPGQPKENGHSKGKYRRLNSRDRHYRHHHSHASTVSSQGSGDSSVPSLQSESSNALSVSTQPPTQSYDKSNNWIPTLLLRSPKSQQNPSSLVGGDPYMLSMTLKDDPMEQDQQRRQREQLQTAMLTNIQDDSGGSPTSTSRPPITLSVQSSQNEFNLIVRQEPIRVRICGMSDISRDRRPIDPPPILQLIPADDDALGFESAGKDAPLYVCHAQLLSADPPVASGSVSLDKSSLPSSKIPSQSSEKESSDIPGYQYANEFLVGQLVSSSYMLHDFSPDIGESESTPDLEKLNDSKQGIFFIFNDLSVRKEGMYQLMFSVFDLATALPKENSVKWTTANSNQSSSGRNSPRQSLLNHHSGPQASVVHPKDSAFWNLVVKNNPAYSQFPATSQPQTPIGLSPQEQNPLDKQAESSTRNNIGKPFPNGKLIARCVSEPFRAYTAKKFPGMLDSSELMKWFAKQGAMKLVVRGSQMPANSSTRGETLGDGAEGNEEDGNPS